MADTADFKVPESALYTATQQADYLDTLADVNDEQVALFHEQGYLAIRKAFTPEQTEAAGQAMWDLIDGKNSDFRGVQSEKGAPESFRSLDGEPRRDTVRKIMKFVKHDQRLDVMAQDPGILNLLTRLMKDTPILFQDMGLIKPPYSGREKAWHQDAAYFDYRLGTTIVGVWIAIDTATGENGCLHIIPGSHQKGPEPHFNLRDWQICDTSVAVQDSVIVPLEPGGCLFWHGMTHHGSPTNHSSHRRRALQYHYRPQNAVQLTKEERLALYGGEQLGVSC